MTLLVLDSGGVSALARAPARLAALREAGLWPPHVPAVVLAEALTGDSRRDFDANRLLRTCQIRDVTEPTARAAARLRSLTRRAGEISATDAIVVAHAASERDPSVVLTSDLRDLGDLASFTDGRVAVVPV